MICRKAAPPIAALEQVVVGAELRAARGRGVAEPLQPEELDQGRPGHRAQVELADPRDRERVHRPGAMEGRQVEWRVEHGQRQHPVRVPHRPLGADRAADVVDDEVAALDAERVDRLAAPAGEPAEGVVEARAAGRRGRGPGSRRRRRAARASASSARTLRYRKLLAGTPWKQTTGLALALLANEALHAAGGEAAARGPVLGDDAINGGRHGPHVIWIAAARRCSSAGGRQDPAQSGFSGGRRLAIVDFATAPATSPASVPLTRSREAKKGRT